MPNTYHPAPDVQRVARCIIAEHHSHLLTNGVYVKFLFCEEPEKVKGREALGTARKQSGLNAWLALQHDPDAPRTFGKVQVTEFFLIVIYQDFWKARDTTDLQRRALVDHELSHCWSEEKLDKDLSPTGEIILSIHPHDLEEFDSIASRYGAWRPDITAFAKALRDGQPGLFDNFDNVVNDGGDVVEDPLAEGLSGVTLTTRQGTVTVTADKLREQAERSRA